MEVSPFLSVVVPVYNEQDRLDGLRELSDYLRRQPFSSEIVVVNDGSTDQTSTLLHALGTEIALRLVEYTPNRGKGYALRQGMLTAVGAYRLFIDVDLSTPLSEFEKFLPHLTACEVIIASRKREEARVLRHQAKLRETLGRGFTLLSRLILGVPISDFTCGFKCFSAHAAEAIFARLSIERWGFDAEAMFLAWRLGYSIKEIPVIWSNDPRTKVKLPDDLIRSLSELLVIRLRAAQGRYDLGRLPSP